MLSESIDGVSGVKSGAWNAHDDKQNVGMSQSAKSKGKLRDPPPSLFLHPSPAASHASLPGILAPGAPQASSSAGVSPLPPQAMNLQRNGSLHTGSVVTPSVARPARNLRTADSARSTDRTDALWAEMQATLEEVELSASGGTHVFGPDHDRKLEELRAAQIALAQAWARSEADDAIETGQRSNASAAGDEVRNLKGAVLGETGMASDGGDGPRSTTGSARPGSSGGTERLGAKLEQETEVDILLARKRREANDRYFQRVNQGVLDVVAKLEDVAVAMQAVEQETKDIWGDNDSMAGSAKG
ncbi:uncharacterized protein CTRU02_203453 [Colletotrichum truncatum]|uniref:Uncharacterized protein n=1 Tax=Colletotrichum truncatum TaxID=5467 RepID=A0ACC3Z9C6_COLTU|nr:uncharacterized protein CTRU02_05836 [Colletotrichum truncatum]KAF6793580.1 hypothetical protein CTRU02_05836 [Colletotrichum truncatum]